MSTREPEEERTGRAEATSPDGLQKGSRDPLGSIVGKFSSGDGVTDVSSNTYAHVADAAMAHWESPEDETMTTMEHVIELVRRLGDERLGQLERELVTELGGDVPADQRNLAHDPLGAFVGMDDGVDDEDQPRGPLDGIIDLVGDEYDGPTDVSSDKYRYVAEAIEANWDRR